MIPFDYRRPAEAHEAVAAVADRSDAAFLAGGTNLIDHMKLGVATPELLVDVTGLPLDSIDPLPDGGLRIGANVRNSDLAADPRIRRDYPMLSRALLAGASGQLRNQATTGGNLLQRTRCVYFQDVSTPCNKRDPGSGCSAIGGYARYHAILGASSHCIAVHPSDMAVAMVALDAVLRVLGPDGERTVDVADLYRLPGDQPHRDTVLSRGELITAIELPPLPIAHRSTYRKVRDRASYAFALVSVAAALDVSPDDGTITDARVAFGGVAHKPWRATLAEQRLIGQPATGEAFAAAADAELRAAAPARALSGHGNDYKIPMLRRTVIAVLRELAGPEPAAAEEHR